MGIPRNYSLREATTTTLRARGTMGRVMLPESRYCGWGSQVGTAWEDVKQLGEEPSGKSWSHRKGTGATGATTEKERGNTQSFLLPLPNRKLEARELGNCSSLWYREEQGKGQDREQTGRSWADWWCAKDRAVTCEHRVCECVCVCLVPYWVKPVDCLGQILAPPFINCKMGKLLNFPVPVSTLVRWDNNDAYIPPGICEEWIS